MVALLYTFSLQHQLAAFHWSQSDSNSPQVSRILLTILADLNSGFLCQLSSIYDTKQSDGEVPVMLELWGMQSTPSLPSLLHQIWPRVVTHDRVLSLGQVELNVVLMLNWIAWNRTVLISILRTYAKLNCLKCNWFSMLNWIIWNRTVLTLKLYLW